jgi:hypothetical protein
VSFFGAASRGPDLARIARDLIEEHREELGLATMPGALRVKREFASLGGHHLRLEQTLGGVPVFASEVSAHVARDGRPLLVQADVYPVEGAETVPSVGADAARAAAIEFVADDDGGPAAETKTPRLMILPEGRRGRLVWRVDAATATESARLFVDAADGEVVRSDSLRVGATGVGAVFDPNPVYVLRDGSLKDMQDRDSAALTAARVVVTLPRLDGSGFLRGDYADVRAGSVRSFEAGLDWTSVTRAGSEFEQVMAYFHIDRAQQRLQDLGIANANAEPQQADAHAFSDDQSYYDAFTDTIRFGDGGVDDAEDADVIRHEYGHALQFDQVEDFGAVAEGAAMGEGFGDFHAASFHAGDPALDPLIASWDAVSYSHTSPPYLRRVDEDKHYPEDVRDEPHLDGEIWSRLLWDLRGLLGNDEALRLVVESHFLLTPTARFTQGANSLLLANESLRGGRDDLAIRALIEARGIVATVPLADPPADDAFEPNDDVDHAASVAAPFHADLVSADDDWYRLDVRPNRRWHVTISFDPDAANLDLGLYAHTGQTEFTNELVEVSEGVAGSEAVDASAGPFGASFRLRVHEGGIGTRIAAYQLHVVDADLPALEPGRSTVLALTPRAPIVYRVDVPASKVGKSLRVGAKRRHRGGAAPEIRVTSPSGATAVDFGTGPHARVALDEVGAWIVEVRSRDVQSGGARLRATFDH